MADLMGDSAIRRQPGELDALRAAADRGDLDASLILARRLLVGRNAPFSPEEGIAVLTRAAERGHGDSLGLLATLKAAGAWMGQSWDGALDCLAAAAGRGSERAGRQLALLASETDPSLIDSRDWRGLRARVNLEAWVTPPERVQVSETPRIWTLEKFARPELCEWLMRCSDGKLMPAMMYDINVQRPVFQAHRTCSDFVFDIVETDLIMLLLRIRASVATSLPVSHMEPPQIFHYALGEEIKAHYDTVRVEGKTYAASGYDGDRIVTLLLYLNDGYEGGDLEFPKTGYRHRGRQGDAVFFASQKDGKPDTMSLHAARPIAKGEKYILSQWIHDRPFTYGT